MEQKNIKKVKPDSMIELDGDTLHIRQHNSPRDISLGVCRVMMWTSLIASMWIGMFAATSDGNPWGYGALFILSFILLLTIG
jgi:hypothetical protein